MAKMKDILKGKDDEPEDNGDSEIITAESKDPKVSVEHFMALVEHKPHVSMLEVEGKQDGFFYRLVNNDPHRIRYYKQLGYEVVTDEDDATITDETQPDGRRIAGADELVLMKQPEELHQMHRAALDRKATRTRRGPIESFKNKARELGFETIDTTREQIGPIEAVLGDDYDD